jgi:hypothetical protein
MSELRDPNYFKEYYRKHKVRRKGEHKIYYDNLRKAVIDILGGKCIQCDFDDIRALQIDHIEGGGSKDKVNVVKNIHRLYYKVIIDSVLANENKYQLLCANCNWIKRFENKEVRK